MSPTRADAVAPDFLAGGGACGALIAARDWSGTPLGDVAAWPQSLKTACGLLLRSPVPMVMLWGEDGVMIYNDAYSVFAGGRHPQLLGSRVREGWPEVAAFNDHVMKVGLAGGTLQYRNQELTLHRHGRPEQVFMNLDYSPVPDESGAPAGVLAIVVETTAQVAAQAELRRSEARLSFLNRLGEATQKLTDATEVMAVTARVLGEHLGVAVCAYADMEPDQDGFTIRGDWTAPGAPSIVGSYRLAGFGETAVQELRAGRPLVTRDTLAELGPEQAALFLQLGLKATICMPLVKEGRLTALMAVHAGEPRDWTEGELALVAETTERSWAHIERTRSQAALRASQERLSRSHAAARLGDFAWDVASGALGLSGEYPRLLGRAPDALPTNAADFFALMHPADRDRVEAEAAPMIAGQEERLDSEYRIVRGDGTVAWIAVSAEAEGRLADGRAARVVGVNYDVTARRQAEEALRESEARFRLMADAVPQIVWITDTDGRTEFFNKQWFDYTGVPHAPATAAQVAADHVHPDDAAATMAAFEAARRTGTTFLVEHRIRSAAGGYRWFLVRGEPHRDPATGEIVRWFGASVDIHDRRLAEERLRELNATLEERVAERTAERNMLATILETTDVMVMALDLDYDILAMNAANADEFERIYGKRPKTGDNLLELLSDRPADQEQVKAGWARGMRGEHVTFVEDFGDPERDRPYYEITFRPLRDDAGEQTGVYQFVTDVTDRLRKEAQLADAREALRQSQKMEAMGQLTGGVAHDMNNLLTPIVGALDLLQRKAFGGEREQRLIGGALQSAERARMLVQRLLAFARRQPLQTGSVDVAALVEDMSDLVASTSGPRVRVEIDLPPDLPPATADANQLEMAILNLAVNARDAMPEGGTLTIAARPVGVAPGQAAPVAPGRYVKLSVSDTGTGMDEAILQRAIEPFFSTKGVGKGTGLGLSMVHGLAAQLHGALDIRSKPGLGTSVELWLPASDEAASASVRAAEPAGRQGAGTALLVDDEELVRATTADMLTELGYRVVDAGSAEEALRLVESGLRPDLLVTDHLMPGLSGTDLVRRLRETHPGLPALVVSGYAEVDGIAPDLPRLTKPFRQAELSTSIAALALR